jgi:hypothetical protein
VSDPFRNPFRTAPGSDPPHLVGRDAELNSAHIALGMTASGEPSPPVIITGLRGMGKTVLLRRAAAEARSGRGIVVYAEGSRREPLTASLQDGLEAAARSVASLPPRLKRGIANVLRALPKAEYELPDGAGSIGSRGEQTLPPRNARSCLRDR